MYPFWALPAILLFVELARYFYRRNLGRALLFAFVAFLLTIALGLWIGFRGDLHSDEWVRTWLE